MTGEWYEKEEITAADLLDMQQAVADAEEAQAQAWADYDYARKQIPVLEQVYESRKWDAECSREELKQMKDAIKEQQK